MYQPMVFALSLRIQVRATQALHEKICLRNGNDRQPSAQLSSRAPRMRQSSKNVYAENLLHACIGMPGPFANIGKARTMKHI